MEDNNQAEANGNATGTNSGDSQTQEAAKFTQADVDRILTERLSKEKSKAEAAQKKAAEEAAAKALTEQGEYKTLAEQRAQRIAELEALSSGTAEKAQTLEEQLASYKVTLESYVKAQRKNVPSHISALLDNLDLPAQLKWLTENGEKLNVAGVPETQKANGTMSDSAKQQAQKEFERMVRAL